MMKRWSILPVKTQDCFQISKTKQIHVLIILEGLDGGGGGGGVFTIH